MSSRFFSGQRSPSVNSNTAETRDSIIDFGDRVLITGSAGFLGTRLVAGLLDRGFRNLCCFARQSSDVKRLEELASRHRDTRLDILRGNLLSREDCETAAHDAA